MNTATLSGRLTATPKVSFKQGSQEVSMARFTLAVKRLRKSNSGEYETDFFDVVTFGGTASLVAKYFEKGLAVIVSGRLQQTHWTTKEGKNASSVELVADTVERQVGSQGSSQGQQIGYQAPQNGYQPPQQGGYQPPQQGGYQPQQGYQPPQQGGYQPPQQSYQPPQQGGYQPQTTPENAYAPQNNGDTPGWTDTDPFQGGGFMQ